MPDKGTYASWIAAEPVKLGLGDIANKQLNFLANAFGAQEANKARARLEAQKQAQEREKDFRTRLDKTIADVKPLPVNAYFNSLMADSTADAVREITQAFLEREKYPIGSQEYANLSIKIQNLTHNPSSVKNLNDTLVKIYEDMNKGLSDGKYDNVLSRNRANMLSSIYDKGNLTYATRNDGVLTLGVVMPGKDEVSYFSPEELLKIIEQNKAVDNIDLDAWYKNLISTNSRTVDNGFNSRSYKIFDSKNVANGLSAMMVDIDHLPPEIEKAITINNMRENGEYRTPAEIFGEGKEGLLKAKDWVRTELVGKIIKGRVDSSYKDTQDPLMGARLENLRANNKKLGREAQENNIYANKGGLVDKKGNQYKTTDFSFPKPIVVGYIDEVDELGNKKRREIKTTTVKLDQNGNYWYETDNGKSKRIYGSQTPNRILSEIKRRNIIDTGTNDLIPDEQKLNMLKQKK